MARTSIQADLGLDTTRFQRGLAKANKSVSNFTKTAGAKFAGVFGAFALAGAAKNMARYVQEMENAAKIAGESSQEFQKFAFAVKKVGIEQDKAADILKDVSDKVGDFLATGAGPMADFFEKVAPKVGVTAEQFRNLSGRDALQLYVSSLEKANVSQNEMTFYLEAIASDASALLPLLRNNSEELNRLADKAEKVGAVIDERTSKAIKNMSDSFDTAGSVAIGFGAKLFGAGQRVIEVSLAMAESVRTGTNVLGELGASEAEAELKTLQLASAQAEAAARAEAMAFANSFLTDELDRQLPTVNDLIKLNRILNKEREKRLKIKEDAAKREQDAFIAEQELIVFRLRAAGENAEAEALQKKINLLKQAIEASNKYNITLKEAAVLVNEIDKKSATGETGTVGGAAARSVPGGTTTTGGGPRRPASGIRFEKTIGIGGEEFQQRFINGRKAGRFSGKQLDAAAQGPKAQDPASRAADQAEAQTDHLKNIDERLSKLDSALSGE